MQTQLRGHPVKASSLPSSKRGFLSLEVHNGIEWKDVTSERAIAVQKMVFIDQPERDLTDDDKEERLRDMWGAAADCVTPSNSMLQLTGGSGNTSTSQGGGANLKQRGLNKGKRGRVKQRTDQSRSVVPEGTSSGGGGGVGSVSAGGGVDSVSGGGGVGSVSSGGGSGGVGSVSSGGGGGGDGGVGSVNTGDTNEHTAPPVRVVGSGKATKRTKSLVKRGRPPGRGGSSAAGAASKVDRLMAGIKQGLYGMNLASEERTSRLIKEDSGSSSSSSSSSDSSSSASGVPSPAPMEEDVTIEEFEEPTNHSVSAGVRRGRGWMRYHIGVLGARQPFGGCWKGGGALS